MGQERKPGFSYSVTKEQIEKYRRWPIERRLEWLYMANLMRKGLPKRITQIQERFHLLDDNFANQYINELGHYLIRPLETKHFPFQFYIIEWIAKYKIRNQ